MLVVHQVLCCEIGSLSLNNYDGNAEDNVD